MGGTSVMVLAVTSKLFPSTGDIPGLFSLGTVLPCFPLKGSFGFFLLGRHWYSQQASPMLMSTPTPVATVTR